MSNGSAQGRGLPRFAAAVPCRLYLPVGPVQQVLRGLELTASVVQELASLSSADPAKAEGQTTQFLETVKVGSNELL